MTLRRYDLNLLPVLDALLRHRSVTRAGQELGLSQSATSHALTRLRDLLNDQLLVASGNEMQLTQLAKAMAGSLGGALETLESLLDREAFDPATSRRHFRIGTGDYVALLLLPELLPRIGRIAPGVTLQITWDTDDMAHKLRTKRLDFAVLPRGALPDEDLHMRSLYADELVIATAQDHPEVGDTIDLDTFLRLPYASFQLENDNIKSFAHTELENNRLHPRQSLLVSNFMLLPFILSGSRHVALLPRRFAERMRESARIKLLTPPFPTSTLHIAAYWSHLAHSDPGHRWLRRQLFESAGLPEMPAEPGETGRGREEASPNPA